MVDVTPLPLPPFKSIVVDQNPQANGTATQPFLRWLVAVDRMEAAWLGGVFGAGPAVMKSPLPLPPLKHMIVPEKKRDEENVDDGGDGNPTQAMLTWLVTLDRMRLTWGGAAFGAGPAVARVPLPPYTFKYFNTDMSRELDGCPTQPFLRWLTATDVMYRMWAGGAF